MKYYLKDAIKLKNATLYTCAQGQVLRIASISDNWDVRTGVGFNVRTWCCHAHSLVFDDPIECDLNNIQDSLNMDYVLHTI